MSVEALRADASRKLATDKRRHLLARMAGNIASGLRYDDMSEGMAATLAVNVAEAILAELERRYPP